jgi:hypothetical protein
MKLIYTKEEYEALSRAERKEFWEDYEAAYMLARDFGTPELYDSLEMFENTAELIRG